MKQASSLCWIMMWALSASRGAVAFSRAPLLVVAHRSRKNVAKPELWKRWHWAEYGKSSTTTTTTGVYMAADDESSSASAITPTKSIESTWNVGGLQKEVSRLTVRCHKKIGKAHQRVQKANVEVDRLTSNPDVTMEELEKCPNVEGLEADLNELQARLQKLNQLEVLLGDIKGKKVVLPEHVAALAISMEVQDEPPAINARPMKKEKGPRNMTGFRLPYRRFYTVNKTEIRVRGIMA
jgi:hypothetical protein